MVTPPAMVTRPRRSAQRKGQLLADTNDGAGAVGGRNCDLADSPEADRLHPHRH